jgi:hypothetical protein
MERSSTIKFPLVRVSLPMCTLTLIIIGRQKLWHSKVELGVKIGQ